jgi:hypothetical protein
MASAYQPPPHPPHLICSQESSLQVSLADRQVVAKSALDMLVQSLNPSTGQISSMCLCVLPDCNLQHGQLRTAYLDINSESTLWVTLADYDHAVGGTAYKEVVIVGFNTFVSRGQKFPLCVTASNSSLQYHSHLLYRSGCVASPEIKQPCATHCLLIVFESQNTMTIPRAFLYHFHVVGLG